MPTVDTGMHSECNNKKVFTNYGKSSDAEFLFKMPAIFSVIKRCPTANTHRRRPLFGSSSRWLLRRTLLASIVLPVAWTPRCVVVPLFRMSFPRNGVAAYSYYTSAVAVIRGVDTRVRVGCNGYGMVPYFYVATVGCIPLF